MNVKVESNPIAEARASFRRIARDFAILQSGMQSLEEDLIGIAGILGIPIQQVPSMPPPTPPQEEPAKSKTPQSRDQS